MSIRVAKLNVHTFKQRGTKDSHDKSATNIFLNPLTQVHFKLFVSHPRSAPAMVMGCITRIKS